MENEATIRLAIFLGLFAILAAAEALAPGKGDHGYSLVTCAVVPGFDFAGFRLAQPGWEPGSGLAP